MAEVSVKVHGDKAVQRELRRLMRRVPNAVGHAMFDEAAIIFTRSQEEVVVDTGRLRGSGMVRARESASGTTVTISYGTNYALRIHESNVLEQRRRGRGGHGKWKYLQDPFEEHAAGIAARVAMRARRHVEGGTDPGTVSTRKIKGKR